MLVSSVVLHQLLLRTLTEIHYKVNEAAQLTTQCCVIVHRCHPHFSASVFLCTIWTGCGDRRKVRLTLGKCLSGTQLSPVALESSSCSCPLCAPSAPPPSRRCSSRRLLATSPSPGSCRTCTSPATYESLPSVQDETRVEGPETHPISGQTVKSQWL